MWNDEDLERGDEQFDRERDLAACDQGEREREAVRLLQSLSDAEFAGLAAQVARGFVPRHQPAFAKVRHLFPGDALSDDTRRIFMQEVVSRLNDDLFLDFYRKPRVIRKLGKDGLKREDFDA